MSSDIKCNIAGISAEWDTDWHIASLFIIIGTSAVGVFLPIISQTTRGFRSFGVPGFAIQIGQFFGAGVIIATAFIHLFPAANSALTNPCLGHFADRYGAWASLIAMAAVFTMHSTEWWLVEAWMGRTKQKSLALTDTHSRRRRRMRRRYRRVMGMLGVQTTIGKDEYRSDSSSSCNSSDDDGDDDHMLFPAYSRAFNASRMMLPPPALSPAVTPYVFGASTASPSSRAFGRGGSAFTSRATGFALSKYGNYAAVVQSRQHLAMISSDHISRYLYSEPQFPHYGPPLWPIPPTDDRHHRQSGRNFNLGSSAQAKSTPELMHRYQKSIRKSHASSGQSSSAKNTQSSNGVSLRPNSFSRIGKPRVRQKAPLSAESLAAKHRCLSMPRLPPTTLEAGICDSLIEPLHPPSSGYKSDNTSSFDSRSLMRSSNLSDSCASSQNPHDARNPVSVAAAAASRRHSLHASTVSRSARASLGEPYGSHGHSASRLDPVPETDDSWVTSMPYRSADNVLTGLPPLSESLRTQIASGQTTYLSARTHKRVSIPTPPTQSISQSLAQGGAMQPPIPPLPLQSPVYAPSIQSELASNGRISQSLGGTRYPRHSWQKKNCQDAIEMAAAALSGIAPHNANSMPATENPGKALGTDDDQDSTAIVSQQSSLARNIGLPADVKRQALATYILEIGIALYSVLIGLALAISDHGFLALFIAICFHQFFEGLALGTSLAELYWIKTQIAAHKYEMDAVEDVTLAPNEPNGQDNLDLAPEPIQQPDTNRSAAVVPGASARSRRIESTGSVNFEKDMHVIDPAGFGTERQHSTQQQNHRSMSTNEALNSDDFEYHSTDKGYRQSKSRRTLTSMATSFTPEPWQVNPQLEVSLGNISQGYVIVGQPPEPDNSASTVATSARHVEDVPPQPRYLQPRTEPERLPGWWKAWISALAFTMTTPTGIIIGLAIRHVYEPNSVYALLLNGVLQSICTGVLIYVGLVTLMIGGFNSIQVKHMSRIRQIALFFAVYAGAAVMASLKIWK
ncbi:hypothetical protein LPJ53_002025 [Coemansia erecta]|uniref:Zip-domain-containing protein n=1 Tax=Coemansia erecta TaxID=147472 RepID=A0A9W8CU95_9FUNG|nr:hypothetical protein LPJ53_002025 [Coemansia erecta]